MCNNKNIVEERANLFKKIKCKPPFSCWILGCSYKDNPEKCPAKIWICDKCKSENIKLPPETRDNGFFDNLYYVYICKDCKHENIRY